MADAYEISLAETQFSQELELALQQTTSYLRPTVRNMPVSGAKMLRALSQIEPVQMKAVQGRFQPKNKSNNTYTNRWVGPTDFVGDDYIDTFDLLKTKIAPQGETVASWAAACNRAFDDVLISAAFGTNQIGVNVDSLSNETFDDTKYTVDEDFGGTGSGLIIAKLIEAKRIMRKNHVDLDNEEATLIIGSQQEADLLKQSQVVSSEFNKAGAGLVIESGRVTRLYGFNIKVMERLPLVESSAVRNCLAYVKSGLVLATWQDIKTQIFQDFTLEGNPFNISTILSHGATRTRPGKVIKVQCVDSTGADTTP